ncbi:MAG: stalk domain-containing protein [Defluviitaleaceae bacterium]|nr:stalk domain-containing protein [Defluviitaleaceae bacterium]
MKKFTKAILAVVMSFVLLGGIIPMQVQANDFNPTQMEVAILAAINTQRINNNLTLLTWCNFLGQAARLNSTDMAVNNLHGDIGSDGSTVASRVNARVNLVEQGRILYSHLNQVFNKNSPTADVIVNIWMTNQAMRDIIMNTNVTHIGVGFHNTDHTAVVKVGGQRVPNFPGENATPGTPQALAAPVITLAGSTITWPAVPNALVYEIFVNNNSVHFSPGPNFNLAILNLTGTTPLPVHIVALSDTARTLQSQPSNRVYFTPQLGPYTPANPPAAVTGRITFEGRQYQVFDTGLTWDQAQAHAVSIGGHLATITSNAQQQFIVGLLQSGNRTYYWLGGRRIAQTGINQFEWITDDAMAFTNWAPSQPSNSFVQHGGQNRMVIARSDSRWHDLHINGVTNADGTFERRNLGFIVEWPPEAIEEDGPSISTFVVEPSTVAIGQAVAITASGIADAARAYFVTRTAAGVETVIHTVVDPGGIVTRPYVANNAAVNQIIIRLHDVYGNITTRTANLTVTGGEEPTPTPSPTPAAPPPPAGPAPQFSAQPIVTDIGVLLEWNSAGLPSPFGYRVFRATNATEDGVPIAALPVPAQNHFRAGNITFDPNIAPNTTYFYYIRAVVDVAGTLGAASTRAQITTNQAFTGTGNRGFMLMVMGNPFININNQWGQIDPGVGTAPVIEANRTMVPIRVIVEGMGGAAGWNAQERRADLNALGNNVQLWLGRMDIVVNGQQRMMDVAPSVVNDRTLLPLRFVAESLGTQVYWVGAQQMAVIVYSM